MRVSLQCSLCCNDPARTMTRPVPTLPTPTAGVEPKRLSGSSAHTWFHTRDGRRYGWEIAFIVVLKLVLLIVLWFGFIEPWSHPAALPATSVQQFYLPSPVTVRHD